MRFSDGQLVGRGGLLLWSSGRRRYGKHARLAELQSVDHRIAANIFEKDILCGFELDDLSEDVQQIEQVVIEIPGPAWSVDRVQGGGRWTPGPACAHASHPQTCGSTRDSVTWQHAPRRVRRAYWTSCEMRSRDTRWGNVASQAPGPYGLQP